jgi:hypothetical protein
MARYIVQMRRGTAEEWATIGSDIVPLEGELVLELDKSGKNLHRLKIGDGTSLYSELPYISVDSFILPTPISVTIYADKWVQASDNRWYQVVTVDNAVITPRRKVDLQPSSEQISIFHEKDLAFVTENEDGVVSVFCIGQTPTNDYTIQAIVTEVMSNG